MASLGKSKQKFEELRKPALSLQDRPPASATNRVTGLPGQLEEE